MCLFSAQEQKYEHCHVSCLDFYVCSGLPAVTPQWGFLFLQFLHNISYQ